MAVAEYMLHAQGKTRQVPDFIGDRGHWYNPSNHTYIGWVSDNPDFYVPDTIKYLTKEMFITRLLEIHQANPIIKPYAMAPGSDSQETFTVEELTELGNNWFDNFVHENTGK